MRRRPEIIRISLLLLAQRFILFLILLVNLFIPEANEDDSRIWLESVGISIHLASLILMITFKHPFFQIIHSPLVIISHQVFVFNHPSHIQKDDLVSLVAQIMAITVCIIAIS